MSLASRKRSTGAGNWPCGPVSSNAREPWQSAASSCGTARPLRAAAACSGSLLPVGQTPSWVPPTGRWPCLVEAALAVMHGAGVGWAEVGAIGTQAGLNFCLSRRALADGRNSASERHLGHRDPGTRCHGHRRIQRGGIGVASAGGHCGAAGHALTASKRQSTKRCGAFRKALANNTDQPEIARSTLGRIWGERSPAPGNSHRQSLSAAALED